MLEGNYEEKKGPWHTRKRGARRCTTVLSVVVLQCKCRASQLEEAQRPSRTFATQGYVSGSLVLVLPERGPDGRPEITGVGRSSGRSGATLSDALGSLLRHQTVLNSYNLGSAISASLLKIYIGQVVELTTTAVSWSLRLQSTPKAGRSWSPGKRRARCAPQVNPETGLPSEI